MRTLLACLLLALGVCAPAQTVLRVGVPEGTQPYIPLVRAIYAEMGLQGQFIPLPGERSLRMLDQGELDADLGRGHGTLAQYPNVVEVEESVLQLHLLAVVREDFGPTALTPVALRQWRLGSVRGVKMADAFLQRTGSQATEVNSAEQMYQMLRAGRIDVALASSSSLDADPALPGAGLRVLATPLSTTQAVHVLHKRWSHLAAPMGKAIRSMRADGRIARIMAQIRAGTAR
ncbi:MAG: substrate-binding periplasmic protein [Rhodoferax sp.]